MAQSKVPLCPHADCGSAKGYDLLRDMATRIKCSLVPTVMSIPLSVSSFFRNNVLIVLHRHFTVLLFCIVPGSFFSITNSLLYNF